MTSESIRAIEAAILDYLRAQVEGPLELDPNDDLVERGVIDSIGVLHMVVWLEDEFDLLIPDDDVTIENFGTLRACTDYINWRRLS